MSGNMHARGSLQRVEHPQYGNVVLPQSAIRHEGISQPAIEPSGALGADNQPGAGGLDRDVQDRTAGRVVRPERDGLVVMADVEGNEFCVSGG